MAARIVLALGMALVPEAIARASPDCPCGPSEPSGSAEDVGRLRWATADCLPRDACWQGLRDRALQLVAARQGDAVVAAGVARVLLWANDDAAGFVEGLKDRRHAGNPTDRETMGIRYCEALLLGGTEAIEALDTLLATFPCFGLGRASRVHARVAARQGAMDLQDRDDIDAALACPEALGEILAIATTWRDDAFWSTRVARMQWLLEQVPPIERLWIGPLLWKLEFQLEAPSRHDELRRRTVSEQRRIETLLAPRYSDSAGFWSELRGGYWIVGDDDDDERLRELVVCRFPCSSTGVLGAREAWPDGGLEGVGDDALERLIGVADEWLRRCPDEPEFRRLRFDAVRRLSRLSPDTIREEVDRVLVAWEKERGWVRMSPSPYGQSARLLVDHGMDASRAVALAEAEAELVRAREVEEAAWTTAGPLSTSELRSLLANRGARRRADVQLLRVEALLAAGQRSQAGAMVDGLAELAARRRAEERFPEEQCHLEAMVLLSQSLLALQDGKATEAKALLVRAQGLDHGVGAGSRAAAALRAGGGGAGPSASEPALERAREATARWQEMSESLAPFELFDVRGERWCSSDFAGRTSVFVVWATWCEPCREELPSVQRLARSLSARPDVAILTLNVDDNVGRVRPFLKARELDLPALLAAEYVKAQRGGSLAIPVVWIVDPEGIVRRALRGFAPGGALEWEQEALDEILAIAGQ